MKPVLPSVAAAMAAAVLCSASAARAAAPPRKTPELVAKGKASYATNCATCHGPAGLGDGEAAAALDPKPRNLVSGTYKNGATAAAALDYVAIPESVSKIVQEQVWPTVTSSGTPVWP